jgi:hypothetical protein
MSYVGTKGDSKRYYRYLRLQDDMMREPDDYERDAQMTAVCPRCVKHDPYAFDVGQDIAKVLGDDVILSFYQDQIVPRLIAKYDAERDNFEREVDAAMAAAKLHKERNAKKRAAKELALEKAGKDGTCTCNKKHKH